MNKHVLSIFAPLGLCLVIDAATADTVEARYPRFARHPDNVFTRMFPDLPAFAQQTDSARQAVQQMGRRHGILDADDNLSDPIQSIINPAVFSPHNPDNPNMTAGMTFLGQFLDHDITFDKKSQLNANVSPMQTVNFRTAAFDLDSVYGEGPAGSPELYDASSGRIKFIVQAIPGSEAVSRHGAVRNDVPRDASGTAIVAESRNDENVVISQMQVAILSFHNAVTDYLALLPAYKDASAQRIFSDARRAVTWHYQWIILHEFLPRTIGQDRLDDILQHGLKYYQVHDPVNRVRTADGREMPRIPIEFSAAAYRFGHSQIRPSYRLNFGATGGAPFFVFLFDDTQDPASPDPTDLRGGKRAPRRFVDWETFFDFGDGNVRPNKRIDGKLSSVLMALPGSRAPSPGLPSDGVQSLPARTMSRAVNFGIPSGQAVARKMQLPVLAPGVLSDYAPYALDSHTTMDTSTPLFAYILKEAEVLEDGLRLGPVGARIVGEVFVGLLTEDQASYLSTDPGWKPTLPSSAPGDFRMKDLLTFAGVVPPL
ncbi:MAG: Myeloperoxidase, thyroid peroxidase, cyclooxygenase catalytic domain [Massilia sp.]|nr:Myeloperoxidase, thyroid peroxidase, cyclooxygenase catalytic domain [Massilia sp.]MDB5950142.1 Myeloperoxidase, thyroid peroxidase, cyclooxygenase catalytic domain [Massilia sp.]